MRERQDLRARLAERVLVCDGAMGTMLHASGVSLDRALPELSVSRPELVRAIHSAYIAAGAEIIETNSFGANRVRLARHGLEERVAEINQAAVRVAQQAREQVGVPVLIAGSVGPAAPPSGRGALSLDAIGAALREQMAALLEAGVDLLILETFGDLREMVAAVQAARGLTDLPLVAQMTFMEDGRTLAGDTPAEVAAALERLGVDVAGVNCTLGPQGVLEVLRALAEHTALPLAAQPNAGPPVMAGGRFQYTADGAYFARYARRCVEVGAAIVGGCCGTTPDHIEAVAGAVAGMRPGPRRAAAVAARPAVEPPPPTPPAPETSQLAAQLAAGHFVVACELHPSGDGERLVQEAAALLEAGADVLAVAPAIGARAPISPVALALLLRQRLQVEVLLTATTWERSLTALQADLLGAHALGIRNVLCRTGTPPPRGDYPSAAGIWEVDSLGLIAVLQGLNEGRDCNAIPLGKPTAFFVGARVNPTAADPAQELERARAKLAAGARFLATPPVYDLAALQALLDALAPPVPVLLGVMPLRDFAHAEYLQHEVPEMAVPEPIARRMWAAGEAGATAGIVLAEELIAAAWPRVQGVLLSAVGDSAAPLVALVRAARRLAASQRSAAR